MIKGIIFDFGGVFDSKHESLEGFREAAIRYGLEPEAFYDLLYSVDAWWQAKLGQIGAADYWRRVMVSLGHGQDEDVEGFRQRLFAGHQLDGEVVRIAEQLAERFPLALLSNATDELETLLETQYGVHHLFNVLVNSARAGVAKPDPGAYRLALDGLGIGAAEALFIDDKPRNVSAARALGIQTIHFTDAAALRRGLIELDLLPPEP